MKKILAVILAVLLLGSAAAFAENAPVLDLKDPVLDLTVEGETKHIDLAGLTLRFGVVGEGDDACLALNILGNGEPLFAAALRQADGRILLTADGLSHSYAVTLPAADLVASGTDESAGEGAASAISGEVLQKFLAEAEIDTSGDPITFRLPYTAVNKLLKELLPSLEQIPNADELIAELEAMEAEGNGLELNGSLSMTDGTHVVLDFTPVSGGAAADEPAFRVQFDLNQLEDGADFSLAFVVPSEGSEPAFQLEGSVRSGDQGLNAHLDVYASGARMAVFELAAGEDFSLRFELADSFRFEAGFERASGQALLAVESDAFSGRLTAVAETGEGDVQVCRFPNSVIEVGDGLSDEQKSELSGELQAALGPVIQFVAPMLSEAGVI